MPSDLLCLERQVAGGVVGSLACIAVAAAALIRVLEALSLPGWLSPSSALVCRTGMVSTGSAQSACSMRHAHAPWPCLCSLSARNGLSTTGRFLLGPGWERRPGHPHALCAHAGTKPEVNLDCVLAAARGCAL